MINDDAFDGRTGDDTFDPNVQRSFKTHDPKKIVKNGDNFKHVEIINLINHQKEKIKTITISGEGVFATKFLQTKQHQQQQKQ